MNRRQVGSIRFVLTLAVAVILAATGIWLASRKTPTAADARNETPVRSVDYPTATSAPPAQPANVAASGPAPVRSGEDSAEMAERTPPADSHRVAVTGTVLETREYCGGANPTDEILEAHRAPRPVAGKTLFVRTGSVNSLKNAVVAQFTTNGKGGYTLQLPLGVYCVVEAGKKEKLRIPDLAAENRKLGPGVQAYRLTSEQCLVDWWQRCDAVLKVGPQGVRGAEIEFHRSCQPPCIEGGPIPI